MKERITLLAAIAAVALSACSGQTTSSHGSSSEDGGTEGALPAESGAAGTGVVGGTSLGGTGGAVSAHGGTVPAVGSGGTDPLDPSPPPMGSYKVLVYSRTGGFRATNAIDAGKAMLEELGQEHDFEPTFTETNEEFTIERLANYQVLLFLQVSGNVLDADDRAALEDWLTTKNSAFVGIGRVVEAEFEWSFYKELTGQHHEGQSLCCPEHELRWDPDALDFRAVQGMPSPWRHSDLWFFLGDFAEWSQKPGFRILSWVDLPPSTTPPSGLTPVSFVREWSSFRSFVAVMGHEPATYSDPDFRRYVAGGIAWAARREHLPLKSQVLAPDRAN